MVSLRFLVVTATAAAAVAASVVHDKIEQRQLMTPTQSIISLRDSLVEFEATLRGIIKEKQRDREFDGLPLVVQSLQKFDRQLDETLDTIKAAQYFTRFEQLSDLFHPITKLIISAYSSFKILNAVTTRVFLGSKYASHSHLTVNTILDLTVPKAHSIGLILTDRARKIIFHPNHQFSILQYLVLPMQLEIAIVGYLNKVRGPDNAWIDIKGWAGMEPNSMAVDNSQATGAESLSNQSYQDNMDMREDSEFCVVEHSHCRPD